LHSILDVGLLRRSRRAESELLGDNLMKRKKSNIVPKQRQAPVHTAPLGFLLYKCY
jgi:hypothetical protein